MIFTNEDIDQGLGRGVESQCNRTGTNRDYDGAEIPGVCERPAGHQGNCMFSIVMAEDVAPNLKKSKTKADTSKSKSPKCAYCTGTVNLRHAHETGDDDGVLKFFCDNTCKDVYFLIRNS